MVWSRLRPLSALALSLVFLLSALPTTTAETEPQVFFYEPFDDLDGWTFEGDAAGAWGRTDNRAHNGTSLYLGDDQGTADPEDNRFDCFRCRGIAISPPVDLPADTPAFLYFWTYVEIDTFDGAGFTMAVAKDGAVEDLGSVPQLKGSLIRFDLGAYAGETVNLVFDLKQGWPWREEGLYLDDVLVTDLEVEVAKSLTTEDDGPALETFFTIPAEGTSGILELAQEGRGGSSIGAQFYLFHDGQIVYGSGFWARSIGPNIDIDLLGEEVVRYNATSGGWGIRSSGTLDLGLLQPGDYRLVSVLHGTHTARSGATIYVDGALDAVRLAGGGQDVAYAFLADFDAALLHIGVADESLIMLDGHISRETTGRAIGLIELWAVRVDADITVPDSATREGWAWFTEGPGTWAVDVHRLVGGDGFPAFQVVQFAVLPDAVDLPASDASALPITEDTPTKDPEPEPEPEPWPTGYNVTGSQTGFISCSVAKGPVQTTDLCRAADPNSRSRFSFPLDNGTTSIDLQVSAEAGPLGEARVCATVLRPVEVDEITCSDDGRLTIWTAAEGEALTRGDETLEIDVRIASDEGVLYQQRVQVDVETEHWGGAA